MKRLHLKRAMMSLLVTGILLTGFASTTMARERCRTRDPRQQPVYFNDRDGDRYDDRNDNSYNRDDEWNDRHRQNRRNVRNGLPWRRDREDTTGKAVGRTALGAGIGAAAGALIGGGKGAVIGAAAGAAGGYIYHRGKVNTERRQRRWPW